MATFQTLPGFRESYPDEFAQRSHIFRLWRQSAAAFGFVEYDGPVLEPLDLYRTKSGEEIEQQLFSFSDKGGREVALRPEMTPTVCRLVAERGNTLKRPLKWFSIGEFYRYERMQKGRGRSFFQLNADLFGEPGPEAEIELIALLIQSFTSFGLTEADFRVRLSDRDLWFYFLEAAGLDDERARAMLGAVDKFERNGDAAFAGYSEKFGPIPAALRERISKLLAVRSLDALESVIGEVQVPARLSGAPAQQDASAVGPAKADRLTARLSDWRRLLDGLAAMGLGDFVEVDLGVVRGLAYYTGFVFEAFDRKGELRALAGGGRYNDLVKKLGGPDMPAAGFAVGDVTFSLLLQQRGLAPAMISKPEVYCVLDGDAGRRTAFPHIRALRAAGIRTEYSLKELAFGKQFKAATESGARLAVIYGQDELAKKVVKVRDLTERAEHDVPLGQAVQEIQARLRGE